MAAVTRQQILKAWQNGRTLSGTWREVLMLDPCVYCGAAPTGLDHIVPQSDGGSDGWENRAPACRNCDQLKGGAALLYFLVVRAETEAYVARHRRRYRTRQAMLAAAQQRIFTRCHYKERAHNKAMQLARQREKARPFTVGEIISIKGSVAEPGIAPPC